MKITEHIKNSINTLMLISIGSLGLIGSIAILFLLIFGIFILMGFILECLWNHVIVNIFSLPYISFWQMLGLFLFVTILFKGINFSFKSKE